MAVRDDLAIVARVMRYHVCAIRKADQLKYIAALQALERLEKVIGKEQ